MSTDLSVAVVVLNWNGEALLRQFLPNWVEHTAEPAELFIVDNGSSDGSVAYLHTEYPEVGLICFDKNYGFAEGYNRAIAMLQHDIVVLLNSDAALTEGWLDQPLALLKDPSIGALQPKLRAWRVPQTFEYAGAAGGYIDALGYPYCRGRIFNTIEEDYGQYDQVVDITWATGACLIVRREIYIGVGGLDARFFAHQEEIDLCWRIRARGWRIVCATESVVLHVGGASLEASNPRKTFLNFRNNLLMLYKNLPLGRLITTLIIRLGLDTLALLMFVVSGRWGHGWAIVRAWIYALALMPKYQDTREENLRKAMTPTSQILSPISIIYRYHLKGYKTFKQL